MCVELQQREHGTQTGVGRGFPEEVMPVLNLGHIADNQAGGAGKGASEEKLNSGRGHSTSCKTSRQGGMWFSH